jgi:hypothetical protein
MRSAVVRYAESCEDTHVSGSSDSSVGEAWPLSAKYDGSVSARGLRSEGSSSDGLRREWVGEPRGEGRGDARALVRLVE